MNSKEVIAQLRAENQELRARLTAYEAQRTRWPFLPDGYPQPSPAQLTGEILPAAWERGKAQAPHWFRRGVLDLPAL